MSMCLRTSSPRTSYSLRTRSIRSYYTGWASSPFIASTLKCWLRVWNQWQLRVRAVSFSGWALSSRTGWSFRAWSRRDELLNLKRIKVKGQGHGLSRFCRRFISTIQVMERQWNREQRKKRSEGRSRSSRGRSSQTPAGVLGGSSSLDFPIAGPAEKQLGEFSCCCCCCTEWETKAIAQATDTCAGNGNAGSVLPSHYSSLPRKSSSGGPYYGCSIKVAPVLNIPPFHNSWGTPSLFRLECLSLWGKGKWRRWWFMTLASPPIWSCRFAVDSFPFLSPTL